MRSARQARPRSIIPSRGDFETRTIFGATVKRADGERIVDMKWGADNEVIGAIAEHIAVTRAGDRFHPRRETMADLEDRGGAGIAHRAHQRLVELRKHRSAFDRNHRIVVDQPTAADAGALGAAMFRCGIAVAASYAARAEHMVILAEFVVTAQRIVAESLAVDGILLMAEINAVVTQRFGAGSDAELIRDKRQSRVTSHGFPFSDVDAGR